MCLWSVTDHTASLHHESSQPASSGPRFLVQYLCFVLWHLFVLPFWGNLRCPNAVPQKFCAGGTNSMTAASPPTSPRGPLTAPFTSAPPPIPQGICVGTCPVLPVTPASGVLELVCREGACVRALSADALGRGRGRTLGLQSRHALGGGVGTRPRGGRGAPFEETAQSVPTRCYLPPNGPPTIS